MSGAAVMSLRSKGGAPPQLSATVTRATGTADVATGSKAAEKVSTTEGLQLIGLAQSTDIAQTLIHSSLSSLLYLRDLFPEDCYDQQRYYSDDSEWTYDAFMAGNNLIGSGGPRKSTIMRVLKRGRRRQVDKLMDWLEIGAFDALKRRYLEALQVQIYVDPDKAYEVIETYTFTVRYVDLPEHGGKAVIGLQLESPGGRVEEPLEQSDNLTGRTLTVKKAKRNFEQFIRVLTTSCGTWPNLPERRYMRMYLFYTDDTPDDYHPPGFMEGQGHNIWFPEGDGWKRRIHDLHEVDLGRHSVRLRISHMNSNKDVEEKEEEEEEEEDIPRDLPYVCETTRYGEVDKNMFRGRIRADQVSQGSKVLVPERASKVVVPSTPPAQTQDNHREPDVDLDEIADSFDTNRARSRKLAHDSTFEDIDEMQIATHQPDHDADSQESQKSLNALREMPRNSPPVQKLDETQPVDSAAENMDTPVRNGKNQLSQTKLVELYHKKRLGPKPPSAIRHRPSSESQTDVISCQCGCNVEGDDKMIHCEYCNTWQHLHCYGYLSFEDVPEPYACYMCLLEEKESEKIPTLQSLALMRRGIHVLQMNGYKKDEEFRMELGCDIQTTSRLVKCLRADGFLLALPGYKRKGFSQNFPGKRPYQIVEHESKISEMRRKYFDPLLHIRHHFALPKQVIPSVPEDTSTQLPLPPHTQESQVPPESRRLLRLSLPHRHNTNTGSDMLSPTSTQNSLQRARTMTTAGHTTQPDDGVVTPGRKRRNWPELVGTRITPPRAAKKRKLFDMSEESLDGAFSDSTPYKRN